MNNIESDLIKAWAMTGRQAFCYLGAAWEFAMKSRDWEMAREINFLMDVRFERETIEALSQ